MSLFRKHWADFSFLVGLVIFVLFKIPDLSIAYFWDELGVYVPGALKMKDDGTIGLLPANLEPLYSRGHPLLFVFSQAAWFELFGDDVVTGHTFSLLLGVLTLVAFYWCSRNLAGATVALVASITLAAQPVFYAGAGVILPEMMLALFTIPAVWAIIRQRWWWYALWGSLAMMTKESAIVIPGLALLVLFAESIAAKDFFSRNRWRLFLIGLVPILVFALFLIIQRIQNGWFFFPLHVDLMNSLEQGLEDLWYIFKDIMSRQGRIIPAFVFGLGFVFLLFSNRDIERRSFVISAIFILLCLCFAAYNFYLLRYMLYCIPFLILPAAWFISIIAGKGHRNLALPAVIVYAVVSTTMSLKFMNPAQFGDTSDMSYKRVVALKQEAIDWLEQQPFRDSVVEANFPIFQALADPRNGYVERTIQYSENFTRHSCHALWFHLNHERFHFWIESRPYEVVSEFRNEVANISYIRFTDCEQDH